MNCGWIQQLMAVHRDLDRPERRAVAAHLRVCDECQMAWSEEMRVKAVIAAIPDLEPPPGLEARLLRIPSPPPPTAPPSSPGPRFGPTLLGPAGGSALLAALAIGSSLLIAPHLSRPDAQVAAQSVMAPRPPAAEATIVARGQVPRTGAAPAAPAAPSSPDDGALAVHRPDSDSRPARVIVPAPDALGSSTDGGFDHEASLLAKGSEAPGQRDQHDGTGEQSGSPNLPSSNVADPGEVAPVGAAPPGAEAMVSPVPATSSPTPATCARLSLHVFADVTGSGPRSCAGCDGRFDDGDASLANERGLALPAFKVQVIDADSSTVYDGLVVTDGAEVWVALPELCGAWPMTAHIVNLPGEWRACPSSGSLARDLASSGDSTAEFPLTSGCVEATATVVMLTPMPSATPLPTETPDPVVTPSAQPDPGGNATAQCDPTATTHAQSGPTSLPTTRPEPSPTASPTDQIGVAATLAANLRRTPTATPILRSEQTPPSWLLPSPTPTPKLRRPGEPLRGGR